MKKPVIGILTWREGKRFAEPAYFRRLIREGNELGCLVFLFSPNDVQPSSRTVRGFTPLGTGWQSRLFSEPDVVIDRYRFTPTTAFKNYVLFRKKNSFLYANNRLANKWKVHEVLWRDERMHRWLPETVLYNQGSLQKMATRHTLLYLKPLNGTGGKGILRVERAGGGFRLLGRDNQRAKISTQLSQTSALIRWASRWVRQRDKFIIQQGLRLELVPNRTVDMRLLIQKDEDGEWSVTGYGIRVGGERSATSNLHGGGKAIPAKRFLLPRFGDQQTHAILDDCEALAFQTAQTIENHFGRMLELGLDIGIDVKGRAWLIEVNPKPGREIFRQLGTQSLYNQAIRKPLQYAIHLAKRGAQFERRATRLSNQD